MILVAARKHTTTHDSTCKTIAYEQTYKETEMERGGLSAPGGRGVGGSEAPRQPCRGNK